MNLIRRALPPAVRFAVRYPIKVVRRYGFRALSSATRQLIPNGRLISCHPSDVQHPFLLRAGSSDPYVFEQIYLSREYDFDYTAEPKLIVDAGANIGLASVYFASRFPTAKLVSIEPEPANFALLRRNVAAYGQRIEALRGGLWGTSAELEVRDLGTGAWSFVTEAVPQATATSFRAYTVDQILEQSGLSRIDILKLDIEGAEKDVFEGEVGRWLGRVDLLIVELHEHLKPGCSAAVEAALARQPHKTHRRGENVYYSLAS